MKTLLLHLALLGNLSAVTFTIDGFDGSTTVGSTYGDYTLVSTGGNANFLRWNFEITSDFDNDGIDETFLHRLDARIYNADFDGTTFTLGSADSGTNNPVAFGGHGDPFAEMVADRSYRFNSALIGNTSSGATVAQTGPLLSSLTLASGDYVIIDNADTSNFITSTGGSVSSSFISGGTFHMYNNATTSGTLEEASSLNEFTVTPVPEPSAIGLLSLGALSLISRRKRA